MNEVTGMIVPDPDKASEQVIKIGGFFARLGPMEFLQGFLAVVVLLGGGIGFGMTMWDSNRKREDNQRIMDKLESNRQATAIENSEIRKAIHEMSLSNTMQTEALRQLTEHEKENRILWQSQFIKIEKATTEIKAAIPKE